MNKRQKRGEEVDKQRIYYPRTTYSQRKLLFEVWEKRRIADELAKKNSWVAVTSPNTVREILREKGMWLETVPEAKKK